MKKLLIVMVMAIVLYQNGRAQIRCETAEHLAALASQNPAIQTMISDFEATIQSQQQSSLFKVSSGAIGVVRIPVVVHVVYNTTQQNISDAQIQSQITVLNEDFRRMTGTPGYNNNPVGADTKIEFYMATVDPNGNPTTGITRTSTSHTFFTRTIQNGQEVTPVKFTSSGGKDAWDSEQYLNIWVCNLSNVLGYAQFPLYQGTSGPYDAATDGVVINYGAFGDVGVQSWPGHYDKGRTATHEVGHWIGLRHIWGDQNDCNGTDYVNDTPPCSGQYYSGYSGSCDKPSQCGNPRQIENYMDYSDDRCMNLYTIGQSARMRSVIETYRTYFNAATVTLDQVLENNTTRIGTVGRWNGTNFSALAVTPPTTILVDVSSAETFRGDQAMYSGQKYNNWNNLPDVKNHQPFVIEGGATTYTSHFKSTHNATVRSQLLDGGSPSSIDFKDPWLIDYADPSYGNNLRNQGMSAPFKNVAYSTNNLGTSTSYKGVFLNENPNFLPNLPIYSVNAPNPKTINGVTSYFQNWSATSGQASFQNANTTQTAVVFQQANTTVTANYKGVHLSNTTAAWDNPSQRKLIETNSGTVWLHQVYTSAGHVWIEHSSNSGSTWILGNNGKPLSGSGGGKCPSIALSRNPGSNMNYIGVVWQQPYGGTYQIRGKIFNQADNASMVPNPEPDFGPIYTEPSDPYSVNANPNLMMQQGAWAPYLVIIERKSTGGGLQPGLNWMAGFVSPGIGVWDGPFYAATEWGTFSGTNANTTHAQLSKDPYYDNTAYVAAGDLVYSTGAVGEIYQKFLYFYYDGATWNDFSYAAQRISYPGNVNFSPSVVTFLVGQGSHFGASWVEYDLATYVYGQYPSVKYYYGSGVQSVSVNRGGTDNGFMAWSQLSGSWSNKSIRLSNYVPIVSTIQTLSTAGKYVQVGNGPSGSLSNMRVSSFYPFTSPYTFATSGTLGPLPKTGDQPQLVTGRGFIINRGDAAFSYRLEGLKVDGRNVDFVDISPTTDYGKIEELNNAFVTEPFRLSENSKLTFTEHSGFADSLTGAQALGDSGFVRYKIELIDDATSSVVGTVDNVDLNSRNVHSQKTRASSLETKGMANRLVRARITLATNIAQSSTVPPRGPLPASIAANTLREPKPQPGLVLTVSLTEENSTIADSLSEQLTLNGPDVPTSYALEQNYPNPFNPITQLKYAVPGPSLVSIKVYDILGREVQTLVNAEVEAGYHFAQFDGSQLASGMYFARFFVTPLSGIKKGDPIVQTIKMTIAK